MKDISEHITDIVQNSTRAKASLIQIRLEYHGKQLKLQINDNGAGMSAEVLHKVSDPFYTTRTTRKQGMGLAFLRQNAEQTNGYIQIQSTLGEGTQVQATFFHQHWDMPPMGDIAGAIVLLASGNPEVEFVFIYTKNEIEFEFDTREVKTILEGMPLTNLSVMKALKEMIIQNISE